MTSFVVMVAVAIKPQHIIVVFIGRVKPGWGRESTKPPWWPPNLPWANVRMDARSEDIKHKVQR